ncbi:hypothetical protein JCM8097_003005 [Rhodosporidiobolus ruineniae]
MADPAGLFNAALLDVLVARSSSSGPSPTTFSSLDNTASNDQTDAWIDTLLTGAQRTSCYYDQPLTAHAIVALPHSLSSTLTRQQAAVLFLQSLPQPHLSLNLDLSCPGGTQPSSTYPSLAEQQQRPPLPPRGSSLPLAARIPITPAPFPTKPGEEGDAAGTAAQVPVASVVFSEEKGKVWVGKDKEGRWVGIWEFEVTIPFVRSPLNDPKLALTVTVTLRDDPRLDHVLERAKEGILPGDGGGESASEEGEDDDEWMDDSYDHVNLLSALAPISSKPLHLPFSRLPSAYLPPMPSPPSNNKPGHRSTRSRSYSFSPSLDTAPLHPSLRRSCQRVLAVRSAVTVQMRTVPCPVGALGIADGNRVWERDNEDGFVLCVEVGGASSAAPGGEEGEEGEEGFEIEDMEVNVQGGGTASGSIASRREQHDVEVRPIRLPSSSASFTTSPTPLFPLRLPSNSPTQHNFLYALASVASAFPSSDGPLGSGQETVPIAVASSPQQRFTARFGAEENEKKGMEVAGEIALRRGSLNAPLGAGGAAGEGEGWVRNVAITVTGRPYGGKGARKEAGGYEVPGSGGDEGEGEEKKEEEERPPSFSSRWNCSLDISSFARRSPPRIAAFASSSYAAFARPSSGVAPLAPSTSSRLAIAAAASSAVPPPRPSSLPANVEVESVAGSKRHTMSSLSSLSLKSPIIARRGSTAPWGRTPLPPVHTTSAGTAPPPPAEQGRRPSRALPPTPLSPPAPPSAAFTPTPGATGPPKRFFSLPGAESSTPSLAGVAASVVPPPVRTETPPPSLPSQQQQRASYPSSSSLGHAAESLAAPSERPQAGRRTSWMSNLVGGGSVASSSTAASSTLGQGTSWDRPAGGRAGENGLGIGMEGEPPAPPTAGALGNYQLSSARREEHKQEQDPPRGKLLVSVSLVPLRQAKSRRPKPVFDGSATPSTAAPTPGTGALGRTNENLPPPTLPGLAPPSPDPALSVPPTPRFSFPPASPDPSSNSSSGVNSPALPVQPLSPSPSSPSPEAAAKALAERTNLSTSRMPRVNTLDVFLVEVFISNQTAEVKRFTVGVPPRRREKRKGREREREGEEVARLVPLETDVRIGPLAPNTCASVGLRFLAVRPGAHCVDLIRLTDLKDGTETLLERPVWVVVE